MKLLVKNSFLCYDTYRNNSVDVGEKCTREVIGFMGYVLYFNLAAVISCGVLFIIANAEHRKVSTLRSAILSMLIWFVIFMSAASLAGWNLYDFYEKVPFRAELRVFCIYVYYILRAGFFVGLFFYFYFLVRPYDKSEGKRDVKYFIPFMIVLGMLGANALGQWMFYMDEFSEFQRGAYHWVLHVGDLCYACMIFWDILFKNRKEIGVHKLVPSVSTVCMILIVSAMHEFFFEAQFECFGFALTLMILVMNVQNPREILDVEASLLNYGCFKEEIYKNLNHKRKFILLFLYFGELEDYRVLYENKVSGELIRQAGATLKSVRKNLLIYRVKSDLCVIFYPRDEIQFLRKDIKQIRSAFGRIFEAYGRNLTLQPSILELTYPTEVENLEDIMGMVRIFPEKFRYVKDAVIDGKHEAFHVQREKKQLEKVIVQLAKERYIKVSCIPIYNVQTNVVESAYVGISLKDYLEEDMSYEEFLKNCGNNEQIVTIERQLFDIICSMLRDRNPALVEAKQICIILSNMHFMQDNMVDVIIRTMKRYNVPYTSIAFGVSGTVLNNMNYTIQSNIEKLGEAGIDIFMEQYGVGKANLESLTSMDVNYVEMDASITASIYEDEKYETVMRRQVEVAHNLGTKMLVGSVTDRSQVERLREMGADYYKLKSKS